MMKGLLLISLLGIGLRVEAMQQCDRSNFHNAQGENVVVVAYKSGVEVATWQGDKRLSKEVFDRESCTEWLNIITGLKNSAEVHNQFDRDATGALQELQEVCEGKKARFEGVMGQVLVEADILEEDHSIAIPKNFLFLHMLNYLHSDTMS